MAEGCASEIFTADETNLPGTPLSLDVWLPLSLNLLGSATVTLYQKQLLVLASESNLGIEIETLPQLIQIEPQ